MRSLRVAGRRTRGFGVGGKYVSHPYYEEWFSKLLGCKPYPGTLNLETNCDWRQLASMCKPILIPGTHWGGTELAPVLAWRANVGGEHCLLIRPLKSRHPPTVLELVCCRRLSVGDGVVVEVHCDYEPWASEEPPKSCPPEPPTTAES